MNKNKAVRVDRPATEFEKKEVATTGHRSHLAPVAPRTGAAPVERGLLRWLLRVLGTPPIRFVLWDGTEIGESTSKPVGRVWIRERSALWRLLRNPNLHFGDDYSTGRIEVEGNLVEILDLLYRSVPRVANDFFQRRVLHAARPARANSLSGSRSNIHHHYDIGNDFYRLWLDEEMLYTCAYFPESSMTLEQAQIAKMDHVARKLRLQPGQTVVEAGCGWGSLARHMARHYGVKVKAYNISHEQIAYCRERARAEGLADRIEYIEDDYRTIAGHYDAFVSVGMLEHVGADHYRELGDVIDRCLKPEGMGLIHSIGRNRPKPMNAWIEKRIFPGAYPPTLAEMMQIFEPREFSVLDIENLRLHYAKTLEHWLWRFEKAAERVESMYDREFVRAWRLYLAGSAAAFLAGELQLFQVVFAPRINNNVPWNRAHLNAGMGVS